MAPSILKSFVFLLACGVLMECGASKSFSRATGGAFASREEADMPESAPTMAAPPGAPKMRAADRQRMVVYGGDIKVRVARVESALTRVTEIARQYGGFIENSSTTNYNTAAVVRVRVPVAKFYDAMRDLGSLGQVLEKKIDAEDITREFQDSSLRLNSARRLRARLYDLLKSDIQQKEKVQILKEISRLNEEIEILEGRIKAMQGRASLSTILVRLESLLDPGRTAGFASPFPWVTELKPETRSLDTAARLEYAAPAGYFENREKFAEGETDYLLLSPDGVKIRSGQTENYPRGDLTFWETVLKKEWERRGYKLLNARDLAGAERGRVFFLGVDDGLRSYFYAVSLIVKDDTLNVVEIVFNDRETFTKQREAIDGFLNSLRVLTWQNLRYYLF